MTMQLNKLATLPAFFLVAACGNIAIEEKKPTPTAAPVVVATALPSIPDSDAPVELSPPQEVVTIEPEKPKYALPESLRLWRGSRTAPLYADPDVEPWTAKPTEPRLKNAAISCNYKDEGGVRGRVSLLVDDFKVSLFKARIEMPNGGICRFNASKMQQRPFEQGLSLESKSDECIVRMWEQDHRITVAAYNCHRQCTKGSFSYLWPILMDTRVGTCY